MTFIKSIDNSANNSLTNLTPVGSNVANWSTNTSNCIKTDKQNLIWEISSGSFIIKAGTVCYRPDGTTYTNTTDKTITGSSTDGNYVVAINYNGGAARFAGKTYSGATSPTGFLGNVLWYDTTNNIIQNSADGGSTWGNDWSFPIALVKSKSGSITDVIELYDNYGRIGGMAYSLPTFSGAIPAGRNTNGTLNSTRFTNTAFSEYDASALSDGIYSVALSENAIDLYPATTVYDEKSNYVIDSTGTKQSKMIAGTATVESGFITGISTKRPFHALDWNEKPVIMSWVQPDYTAAISIPNNTNYTCPKDGFIVSHVYCSAATNSTASINGTQISEVMHYSSVIAQADFNFPVSAGDVVKINSTHGSQVPVITFYPYKGA